MSILSHEVRVARHHEVYNEDCALYVLRSQVQLARVVVRVLVLDDVVCVMLVVLIAHVDIVHAVDTVFVAIFCSWRCALYRTQRFTREFLSRSIFTAFEKCGFG